MKVLSQIHTNLWVHTLKAFVMQFAIRFFKICFFGDCLCFVFLLVPGNFCQLMRIWLDRKMRPLKINWGVFSIFAVSLIMPNYENVRSFTSLETRGCTFITVSFAHYVATETQFGGAFYHILPRHQTDAGMKKIAFRQCCCLLMGRFEDAAFLSA